jgi:hypothetical protein
MFLDALSNYTWVTNLLGALTVKVIEEYLALLCCILEWTMPISGSSPLQVSTGLSQPI